MSSDFEFAAGLEPERYELDETGAYRFDFARRDFFKSVGAGLAIALLVEPVLAQESGGGRPRRGGNVPQTLGAWLHIDEAGKVTAFTGKTEVGQNIRTSLAQVIAEELRIPIASIELVMADTDRTPYDAGTFGSRTTPDMARQLRRVSAAARDWLITLAAEEWKADPSKLKAEMGHIVRTGSDQHIAYGKLTKGEKLTRTITDDPKTTPAEDWKVAGQSAAKVNGRSFVTGEHQYTSDLTLPGMVFGRVLRPPSFGATLNSLDAKGAEALPGVAVVHNGDFAGVTAPTEFEASRALQALKATWNTTEQPAQKDLFNILKTGGGQPGRGAQDRNQTTVANALESSEVKLEQSYTVAYIAHAPLEPRAALAQWENDKLTVWTGTQRPFGVRSELARALRLDEAKVRVIVPDTGSGYGGKHTGEAAVEAARLAKTVGKPVKLVWTREEEFTWAYFRPAGVIDVKSGAQKDGTLTAWDFHNYNSGGSSVRSMYDAPQRSEFHSARSPLRQGSYRALASAANHFARETHMDELAHALKLDPLEFRLKNLKDPRLRAVLEAAAKTFGWADRQARLQEGHGAGIAVGTEKGSFVATAVEVHVNNASGKIRVVRAVTAFECGAVLNPEHLKNQIEGCIMMGLGGALFEQINFAAGKILNPRFSEYPVPRFSDTPALETVLLDRKDLPSVGAGETPIVGIAPAIGNAIFAATGKRLRSLPLAPHGLKA